MATDLEIIKELGRETKLEIKKGDIHTGSAKAYETDEKENVIGLSLNRANLIEFPRLILKLKRLRVLRLFDNQLTTLPRELIQLRNLKKLNLGLNPLKQPPPEIVDQGNEAIFEYLRQLPEEATEHNEAKMILVGQGDVGKTCLAKRLLYDTFQKEKSTEGIDILTWDINAPTAAQEDIKLNVWDFGGQEIYHATHQFFLTKRSVYLLVWNARKSKDYEHIYYWLHTIEAFGADSPVILVMTKWHERDDDLNMRDLRERFPQIVGLYKVDSEDGKGIPALREIISKTTWELPHMQTPWIDSWFSVRERLEQDGRSWINYDAFREICVEEGLDDKQMNILDEYLHDLGVIIHFRTSLRLQNMVILKPEWATDAVYKVMDTQSVRDREGILLHRELDRIWDRATYPVELHPYLLELMNEFELAYELPDKKSHLVAELLPSTEPEFEWEEKDNLYFYYRYDFLQAGIITRFIVLIHRDLELKPGGKHLCWREGVVLQREGTRAFVKVRKVEKLIEIRIKGSKQRELLAIIRHQFDHINRPTEKVKITQEIPCNCSAGCPNTFNYQGLLEAERQGKPTVECQTKWKDVPLSALLDGYQPKAEREKAADVLLRSEAERSIIVQPVLERLVEPPKKEEKKWYQKAWAVALAIGALLAGLWTVIQIVESDTFKKIFGGASETQVEEQVSPPSQPGEEADSARVAGEGVDTTDAANQ